MAVYKVIKTMHIVEVIEKRDKSEFINFPKKLYKGDPYWVCQPDIELESIFNPGANFAFSHGEAARWILKDVGKILLAELLPLLTGCDQLPTDNLPEGLDSLR